MDYVPIYLTLSLENGLFKFCKHKIYFFIVLNALNLYMFCMNSKYFTYYLGFWHFPICVFFFYHFQVLHLFSSSQRPINKTQCPSLDQIPRVWVQDLHMPKYNDDGHNSNLKIITIYNQSIIITMEALSHLSGVSEFLSYTSALNPVESNIQLIRYVHIIMYSPNIVTNGMHIL